MSAYPPPLDRFLTLGTDDHEHWPNYSRDHHVEIGHMGELIRMVGDRELWEDGTTDRCWAPMHAWRALGQLRAVEAVGPLLEVLQRDEEMDIGDWALSEVPKTLALVGPVCIPDLAAFLADRTRGPGAKAAAAEALARIVREHPDQREECLRILVRSLEHMEENTGYLNAAIIQCLLDLKGVETAALMERAYQEKRVEEDFVGTWEYVQWELGLTPGPKPNRYPMGAELNRILGPLPSSPAPLPRRNPKERAKARRKIAKASRKRNRKR